MLATEHARPHAQFLDWTYTRASGRQEVGFEDRRADPSKLSDAIFLMNRGTSM